MKIIFLVLAILKANVSLGATLAELNEIKAAYREIIIYDEVTGIDVHAEFLNSQSLVGEAASRYETLANQTTCKKFYSCPQAYSLRVDCIETIAIVKFSVGGQEMELSVFDVNGSALDIASKFRNGDLVWLH